MWSLIGTIFVLSFADALRLRRRSAEVYRETMKLSPLRWAVYSMVLIGLPVYLWKRQRAEILFVGARRDVFSDALGVLLIWVFGMLICGFSFTAAEKYIPFFKNELVSAMLSTVVSFLLALILIRRAIALYPGTAFKDFISWQAPRPSPAKAMAAAVVFALACAAISSVILSSRTFQPITPMSEVLEETQTVGIILVFIAIAVCLAPLVEEIIFRGYFYKVLEQTHGRALAIIVIGGLFGFLHVHQYWGDWFAILLVAFLGYGLTLLRSWSGSMLPSVVTHYIYNFMVALIPMIVLAVAHPSYVEFLSRAEELDYSEKEELLYKSIEEDPDFLESYNSLVELYAEEGKNLDRALALIEFVNKKEPRYHRILEVKVDILAQRGQLKEAVELQRMLAETYYKVERFSDKLRELEERLNKENAGPGDPVPPDLSRFVS